MICDNCDDIGGFCEVHGVDKTAHLVHLCKTNTKYRAAWDAGKGPRQGHSPPRKKRKREVVEPRHSKDIEYILETLCPKCKHYQAKTATCRCGKCSHGTSVARRIKHGTCPAYRW